MDLMFYVVVLIVLNWLYSWLTLFVSFFQGEPNAWAWKYSKISSLAMLVTFLLVISQ